MSQMTINNNPLLCDVETGICEIGNASDPQERVAKEVADQTIKVIYFTDPICSSCWGIEPQLRKLKLEYGAHLEIEYRMGGLLPDWSYNSGGISKPSDVAQHWDEVSRYYEMPIDGDIWLEDPLDSSYPPSIAFKAAELQDKEKAVRFLREMRELVFLKKKNISKWEHIMEAAIKVGLDPQQLRTDFEGAAVEDFKEDLQLARRLGVRGFPTLSFINASGISETVYGAKPYSVMENAVLKMHPSIQKKSYETDWSQLFNQYPSLTTKEYAILSGLSFPDSQNVLQELYENGLLKKLKTKNGDMWYKNEVILRQ